MISLKVLAVLAAVAGLFGMPVAAQASELTLSAPDSVAAEFHAAAFPVQMDFDSIKLHYAHLQACRAAHDQASANVAYDAVVESARSATRYLQTAAPQLLGRETALLRWMETKNGIPSGFLVSGDVFPAPVGEMLPVPSVSVPKNEKPAHDTPRWLPYLDWVTRMYFTGKAVGAF